METKKDPKVPCFRDLEINVAMWTAIPFGDAKIWLLHP